MNKRTNAILVIIVLILTAWFYSLNQSKTITLQKDNTIPDYTSENVLTKVFFNTGDIQYSAAAKRIEYFLDKAETLFFQPDVFVYTNNNQTTEKSWHLSADKATLLGKDQLKLEGNVQIENLQKEAKFDSITTQSTLVNLITQDISSDTMVQIKGKNFITSGRKLVGNLRNQVATIQEQVKTQYEIERK